MLGQQDRLRRGGDTWRNPVSYDKLGVRYRRWRNSLRPAGAAGRHAGDGLDPDSEQLDVSADDEVYVDETGRARSQW